LEFQKDVEKKTKRRQEEKKEREKEKHLLLAGVFSITNLFNPAGFLSHA